MSGLMSDVDHTNALAAEYVLGTLDSEEREQARALLGADTAFAGKVMQWERRLGELHLMVEPVEPDAQIWTRIKSKMPETQSRSNARLPEAHIPEPAPVAIPTAAPSLDAIQAAISETAAVLTSEAAAAPTSEAASPAWETGSPASEITEAPVSEVIEAFGSEPSSVPAPEHSVEAMSGAATEAPTPMPDAASAPDVDAAPAPAALESAPPMTDATPTATPDAAVPAWHATPTPAAIVEPESAPPAVPPPLATAVAPTREAPRRIDEATRQAVAARRGLRRWRAFAILMTLVVLAVAALLAAWKFAPERVPPMLQPIEVLRQVGVELPSAGRARRPVPPPSQHEE
jgi:hypothetical protein